MNGLNGKKKNGPPRTFAEALKRWGISYTLYADGAEGLRLPYDQAVANKRAAGLARLYADS